MENVKNPVPSLPRTVFNLLKEGDSIFTLHYRARYQPAQGHLLATDLNDAKKRANAYCEKYNLRFISVTPFFLNMESNPDAAGDA